MSNRDRGDLRALSRAVRNEIRDAEPPPDKLSLPDGAPLPDRVRDTMEAAMNADFGHVRIHTGPTADSLARALNADAFAVGSDVFFASGAYNPAGEAGRHLLAHELAHTLQSGDRCSARGSAELRIASSSGLAEQAAQQCASRVARRARVPRPARAVARRTDTEAPLTVHRHASYEHRLLGDALPEDLNTIAKKDGGYLSLLGGQVEFLRMWKDKPESVTESMILDHYPYVLPVRLQNSGLLVTYGELNTLPDYIANPGVLDQQPKSIVLPILQAVRQEGYNRLQRLRGSRDTASFADAVAINTGWDYIDLLIETDAIDRLTAGIGPDRTNHYTAAIGRNACHFAPFSWYRWYEFHVQARQIAQQAHEADPTMRDTLTRAALTYNGMADHFLQDSFAAGHLVNKNLVMQWFVEWAAKQWHVPVHAWDAVKHMTTHDQPDLAARVLYDTENLYRPDPGRVTDPQTAEEQPTYTERMTRSGVKASGGASQATSYQRYLAWLNSTVVQSASGVLHDHWNAASLWVASAAHPEPYQIWGDTTMLNGGDGVRIAGETSHASQRAIADILAHGGTDITVRSIADRFPTMVQNEAGSLLPLETWQDSMRPLADKLFEDVHYYLLRLYPTIDHISVDQV